MLVPQISTGSMYHSSLSLLLTLLMSDYDTCVLYKDNRSSENYDFEDLMFPSAIFRGEKSIITLHINDSSSDHSLLKNVNKNHLNIYLISHVDSTAIGHLDRIYNQSNQFDVWNLILIPASERFDLVSEFISKQSTLVSSTTLAMLSAQHDGPSIRNKDDNSWTRLTAINNSLSIQKEMFEKHINLHGQELIVSFTNHPMTNFFLRIFKQPLFIGMDAYIGVEIYQHLNALPVYTSPLIENLKRLREFQIIGTQKQVKEEIEKQRRFQSHSSPYLSLIFDLSKLDKILINLDSVVNREVDINMSPAMVENTNEMDFLYPHDRECITLLIPTAELALSFILRLITSNETFTFGISLVVFWVIRLIVLKSPMNKWLTSLIDTYGFYLAQLSITPQNLGEKLLLLAIMLASIQISALLSAIIFTYLLDSNKPMNNLNEFLKTDLKILMVRDQFNTNLVNNWLSTVSPGLLNRTEFTDLKNFVHEFVTLTSNYALGLTENAAPFVNRVHQENYQFYYTLKENLYCTRTSYHIKHNSPMTQKINELIQGMLENGIIGEYYKWTKQAFAIFLEYEMNIRLVSDSLSLWQIYGALFIYAGGILLCILVFFIEKITYAMAHPISKRSTKSTPSPNETNDDIIEKNLNDDHQFVSTLDEINEAPINAIPKELIALPNRGEFLQFTDEQSFPILAACGVDRKYFGCEKVTTVLVDIETEPSVPETPLPETPLPETPLPETLLPKKPLPEKPLPETPLPDTPLPETLVPETLVPETLVPETPIQETPVPETKCTK